MYLAHSLFKSYKPECVPEKVNPVSLEFAFKNVGKMNQYFHQSQQRLNMGVTRDKRKIEWDVSSHRKRVRNIVHMSELEVDFVNTTG